MAQQGRHRTGDNDDVHGGRSGVLWLVGIAVVLTVIALVGSLLKVFPWQGTTKAAESTSCTNGDDPIALPVIVSPDHSPIITSSVASWMQAQPTINGRCIRATVTTTSSGVTAAALGPSWNVTSNGPSPVVWLPETSLWTYVVGQRPQAKPFLPVTSPKLATSPFVIAMPQPVAKVLGWPQKPPTWQKLGQIILADSWASAGYPQFAGRPRLGLTDPNSSSAGLQTLVSLVAQGSKPFSERLTSALVLQRRAAVQATDTDQLFDQVRQVSTRRSSAEELTLFPASEREVAKYNATSPKTPLAAIYPTAGAPAADHPFVLIKAPWVTDDQRAAAALLLTFLRGKQTRQAYTDDGFRTGDGTTELLTASRGVLDKLPAPAPDIAPDPATAPRVLSSWNGLRSPSRTLVVIDTSGSMGEQVPDRQKTKLALVQEAAAAGLSLFNVGSRGGLWSFSSRVSPDGTDHTEVTPVDVLGPTAGSPQRTKFLKGLRSLSPSGGTALYNTIRDSYQQALDNWDPKRLNVVALLTDGKNDPDGPSITKQALLATLRGKLDTKRPILFVAIAYGKDADSASLTEITTAIGGRTYISRDPLDIAQVIVSALTAAR
jgi:Ca-activated chloride channel homolog